MVYVTSDLHGYPPEKFKELLKKSGFTASDFLVILGDVIDRGEYGAELLSWIIEQDNVELILTVAEDDTGMVIGRHGKIAKAIRQIMKAAANTCGKHVTVEIQ